MIQIGTDKYWRRARLYPALLAVAPLIALLFFEVPWRDFQWPHLVVTLCLGVLVYFLSDFARSRGKILEEGAIDIGPRHLSSALWRTDTRLHPETKDPLVDFVAAKTGRPRPSIDTERDDPATARAFYDQCANWMRDNTRDSRILLEDNVSYGFRRNLLGLKPIGLGANIVTVVMACLLAYRSHQTNEWYNPTTLVIVLCIAAVHGLLFMFVVNRRLVVQASDTYLNRIISLCQKLMADERSKTPSGE
jgi:hypothetical protein